MVEKPPFAWRITLKRRLIVAVAVLVAWTAVIEARLVYLQVVRHADLTARAERQQLRTVETTAKRGDILDRHGRVLAYSVEADSIYAVPTEISDPDAAAAALLELPGVASVFMTADFVTLSKTPEASWEDIAGPAQQLLGDHFPDE